jgi:hypothetical protein
MYIINKLLTNYKKTEGKEAMRPSVTKLIRKLPKNFNVIEEFAGLKPQRKIVLCDHLFVKGYESFENTVQTIWPKASAQDVKKLEKFLVLLKKTAH